MSHNIQGVLTLIFCYLIGSILFGLIISETMYGMDIRKFGSGNVGFTNMKRTLGWKPAIVVLLLDAGKGVLAVWLCRRVFGGQHNSQHVLILLGGVLSILGHNWSVFYDFAGGKGVATSLGVLIALDPRVAALALLVGFPLLVYPGYMSIASVVGTATVPIWFWLLKDPTPYIFFGLLVLVFVVVRHRSNWQRLRQGTESKFSFRGRTEDGGRTTEDGGLATGAGREARGNRAGKRQRPDKDGDMEDGGLATGAGREARGKGYEGTERESVSDRARTDDGARGTEDPMRKMEDGGE